MVAEPSPRSTCRTPGAISLPSFGPYIGRCVSAAAGRIGVATITAPSAIAERLSIRVIGSSLRLPPLQSAYRLPSRGPLVRGENSLGFLDLGTIALPGTHRDDLLIVGFGPGGIAGLLGGLCGTVIGPQASGGAGQGLLVRGKCHLRLIALEQHVAQLLAR